MTLGGTITIAKPEPTVPEAVAIPETSVTIDNEASPTQQLPAAPQTGDSIAIFLTLGALALASVIVTTKKITAK